MARLEHAAAAIVLLAAFVADVRSLVPILAVVFAVHAYLTRSRVRGAEAALLGVGSICFLLGYEVAAWTATLAVAVVCGLAVARPRETVSV